MKYVKIFILLISTFFLGFNYVFATESVFDPTINIEYEGNMVNVLLGFKGEKLDTVENRIAYDKNKVTYIGATPLEDFTINNLTESEENGYGIISVKNKSTNLYDNVNYLLLTFEIKDKVNSTLIYSYDYKATSSYDYYIYRSNGLNIKITKGNSTYTHIIKENNKQTKINYYIEKYAIYVILSIFGIIMLIVLFRIIKSMIRKKENRKDILNNKIDKANNVIIKENKYSEDMLTDIPDKESKNITKKEVPKEGLISINTVDLEEAHNEENNH